MDENAKIGFLQQMKDLFVKMIEAFTPESFELLAYDLPEAAASHSHEIDFIIHMIHLLMLILFIGWGIFFIVALVKFNRRANPKANHTGVTSHVSSVIEIGIVIFEAVLLIGFSIPFWAKQVNAYPDRPDTHEVRVIAEQFAWNFHYPGEDGIFGRTSNEFFDKQTNFVGLDPDDPAGKDDIVTKGNMYLPIGRPVIAHIMSRDVMHSFGVPLMRVKQDAIPGMSIPTWFTPTKSGDFEIVCSQLCGLGHYYMKGTIKVMHEDEYASWLEKNKPSAEGEAGEGGNFDDFWN